MVRVTRNEAAARLKVSKSTLDRMVKRGELVTETEQHGQRHTVWILMDGLVDLFDLVEKMEFERLPQMADCSAREDTSSSPGLAFRCRLGTRRRW